jgi:hypothetical protein
MIGEPVILERERKTSKHKLDIDKVNVMILEVRLALLLIPLERHLQSVYTTGGARKAAPAAG